jgi:hypothetical protein
MEWYISISMFVISIMNKPCVIVIEYATREHLKEVARKSQTYDHIINELIGLKEKNKEGEFHF